MQLSEAAAMLLRLFELEGYWMVLFAERAVHHIFADVACYRIKLFYIVA